MHKEREERIYDEIVVDCYDDEEVYSGWYHYLADTLEFPFQAVCIKERVISPLRKGDEVKVTDIAPYDESICEIFVVIEWEKDRELGVLLSQISSKDAGTRTEEAIGDWHYWKRRY